MQMAGLYIHIPFCKSRCIYCGFYSSTLLNLQDRYVEALCREMLLRRHYLENGHERQRISTVYIGGGTPSQLTLGNMRRLMTHVFNTYDVDDDAEVTVECNPEDVTDERALALRESRVNRVSMGAQTFSDERLRFLGRRHTACRVADAVDTLRMAGIDNISIDLMFGFPGQTPEQWDDDIRQALALRVSHISAYSLTYEEGTPLQRMLAQGSVTETDEEISRAMYYRLVDRLTAAGYEHYEISNFAVPGMRSRHNSAYWRGVPYIGLGAAAHSFDRRSRRWNIVDIRRYISGAEHGDVPHEQERLDEKTNYNETVFLSLRTSEGIDTDKISRTFGREYKDYLLNSARRHIDTGSLAVCGNTLRLSRQGLFISDGIMSDLMMI